ncbi:MAG TPA: hypothetical protein VGL54_02040 [Solirubrobacteraceae bacterium]|jgi:hypothetical protein
MRIKLILTQLLVLGAFAGAFAFASSSALARPFLGSFGSGDLSGIAVDQETGNVYVANGAAGAIDMFGASGGAPAGGVPSEITGLGNAGAPEAEGVAVDNACYYHEHEIGRTLTAIECEAFDPSNGDVYFANERTSTVQKLVLNSSSHEYEVVQEFPFTEVSGVAVDHRGNVYVADYYGGSMGEAGAIAELNPKGEEVGAIPQLTIANPFYIAVGAPGVLYVGDYEGGVAKIKVGSKDEVVLPEVLLDSVGRASAVDEQGGALVDNESSISEYNSAGALLGTFAASGPGAIGESFGVAVNDTSGQVYVSDRGSGVVDIFGPPVAPSLESQSVSRFTQTSAILYASIDPNSQDTTYHFEVGPTTAYGSELPVPDADIGSGSAAVLVSQQATGLSPGTTYHFRVIATNAGSPAGGTVGPDQTFTTPPAQLPVMSTGQALGVAQGSATLTGTVDTQGFETTYEFDLGTDTSYGSRIFGDAGSEPGSQTFAVALQGLASGTTYHYRIAATNIFGTSYGADQTFTTASAPASVLVAPPTAPLIATQVVAFPTEAKTTSKKTLKLKCKKGFVKKHNKCVKNTKKKPKAKKASNERRNKP